MSKGRWPPNVALSHHPECTCTGTRQVKGYTINRWDNGSKPFGGGAGHPYHSEQRPNEQIPIWDCHPECPLHRLDEEVGQLSSGGGIKNPIGRKGLGWKCSSNWRDSGYHAPDKGGPSRFYFNADWSYEIEERLANLALPALYCPKAGRKERDAGLNGERCYHPTVKPLKLCIWLATLLLPPPEYAPRRILVPFAGTGSEMIGCLLAGWEEVVGIEISADYCALAEARLAHWAAQPHQRELAL